MKSIEQAIKYLVILAIAVAAYLGWDNLRLRERVTDQSEAIKAKNSQLVRYVNRLGEEVASRTAAEVSLSVAREAYANELDSIELQYNTKIKNLEALIGVGTVITVTDTLYLTPTNPEDSASCDRSFGSKGRWISIFGNIKGDKLDYTLTAYDSISFILHRKPTGLFRPRELVIEGLSHSPYTQITGLSAVKIGDERRKPFGIGVFVGYGASSQGLGPIVGIGLNYNIISF